MTEKIMCPNHKKANMILRPSENQTKEQKSHGLWFDCPENNCSCSTLIPVKSLDDVQKIFFEMDKESKDYHYSNSPDSNVSRYIKEERGYI